MMMMMMMAAERGHHFQESDLENKKEKKMLSIKPACSRLFFLIRRIDWSSNGGVGDGDRRSRSNHDLLFFFT